MTAGSYPDDGLGEVFLKLGKQGSTLAGVMDAFSMAISIGLQYGVPLETYVSKFTNMRFEPAGLTDDPDVRMSQSIMDYIFRRLALDYLPFETRSAMGIYSAEERQRQLETGSYEPIEDVEVDQGSVEVDDTPAVEPGSSVVEPVEAERRDQGRDRRGEARSQGRAHLRRAARGDHRYGGRQPAVLHLRHQDASGRQLLRLRGLREHQRLQLM